MFPVTLDLFPSLPKDRSRSPIQIGGLFLGAVLEASEPMTIGKHEWSIVIWRREGGGVYEAYIWRRFVPGLEAHRDVGWLREDHWPSYDHNRYDSGLPLTLRELWLRNADARQRHGIGRG